MFKVYWTSGDQSYGKEFTVITEALEWCQYLRNSGRRFVTMASEISGMVGEFGVTETDATYNWKKRRV